MDGEYFFRVSPKNIKLNPDLHISELELKPCGLGSRIREFGAWSLELGSRWMESISFGWLQKNHVES